MDNKFDVLAKGFAQSVTRRQALKKFAVGLAGMAFACFGLASKALANQCKPPDWCDPGSCCCQKCHTALPKCNPNYSNCELQCSTGHCR